MHRPPAGSKSQPPLGHPGLDDAEQVGVDHVSEEREEQIHRAARPGVHEGQGNREQCENHCRYRQAQAPDQLRQAGIASRLQQGEGRHCLGRSLFRGRFARLDLHRVSLEIHHLEIEIAGNALIAPSVEQNHKAVAVLRRLAVAAPAYRDAEPALLHLRDEHVLHVGLVTGDLLHKKHAIRAGRLAENARGNPRGLVAQVHLPPVFFGLADCPGRQEQRQQRHQGNKRRRKQQHGTDPREERKARTEPDHHLRLAVAARKRHEHRNEERQRQQHRKVIQGGKREQRDHAFGEDVSDRRLPEQADELRRQRDGKQRREHRERQIAEFTQQGAPKDHFAN